MKRSLAFTTYALISFALGAGAVFIGTYVAMVWPKNGLPAVISLLFWVTGLVGVLTGVGLWRMAPWTYKSLIGLFGLLAIATLAAQLSGGAGWIYSILSVVAIILFGVLVIWHVYLRTNIAA